MWTRKWQAGSIFGHLLGKHSNRGPDKQMTPHKPGLEYKTNWGNDNKLIGWRDTEEQVQAEEADKEQVCRIKQCWKPTPKGHTNPNKRRETSHSMTTLQGHNGNTPLHNCSEHKCSLPNTNLRGMCWTLNQHQYVFSTYCTTYIKVLNQNGLPEHNRSVLLCDKLPHGYRTEHLDWRMDEKPTSSHKCCVSQKDI